MTNKDIARILKETGDLIELTGGNSFRARAFGSASRTLQRIDESVMELLAEERLSEIRGIGKGLVNEITILVETGSLPLRDEILAALPPGLPGVLKIKGLGVKKVRALWTQLGITSLEELESAARAGMVADLEGFGTKTQDTIISNIEKLRIYQKQRRLADAFAVLNPFISKLESLEKVDSVQITGAMRRRLSTVSSADLIVVTTDVESVISHLEPSIEGGESQDLFSWVGTLDDGFQVRIAFTSPQRFGLVLWQTTGPSAYISELEKRFGAPEEATQEEAIYERAGIQWTPPELRDDDAVLNGSLENVYSRLVEVRDLKGTIHNHSTYSDGAHTLRQMAERARGMGLSYFVICDHSQSLQVANGLTADRVRAQQEEIAVLNNEFAHDGGPEFRIFSGIESDILNDGSLDYPDSVLETFDVVVASVHSGFNMSIDEATQRLVTAIENPYTTILGHPTGRLLLVREGYPVDFERVIDACAKNGVAIELNANPYRLDIDWTWVRRATEAGVLISINPDAHSMDQLGLVKWGVVAARKGALVPEMCLNTKTLTEFSDWVRQTRNRRIDA